LSIRFEGRRMAVTKLFAASVGSPEFCWFVISLVTEPMLYSNELSFAHRLPARKNLATMMGSKRPLAISVKNEKIQLEYQVIRTMDLV
jgi:hypothetical protein